MEAAVARRGLPAASALALLAGLCLVGCGPKPALRIGFLGGLTGRAASFSEEGRNGVILAIEQRNQAGGVGGRTLELVVQDHGTTAGQAVPAFEALVATRVDAVIGPYASETALALLPAIDAARVLVLSPAVTSVALAGRDDHLVRLSRTTRDNAQALAEKLHARGQRRVALATDTGNRAYFVAWRDDFKAAFTALGGQVVVDAEFTSTPDTSFEGVVRSVLAAAPDALVAVTSSVDAALIAQQMAKQPQRVPMAAIAASDALLELGGGAVEGMLVAQAYNRADDSPRFRSFVEAYRARFDREPSYSAIASYDAVLVLAQALAQAAPGEPLRDAVLHYQPYEGVQGAIRFDGFGDGTRPAFFSVVRHGRFEPL
ncbi:ABC transporter substrate-binding protein [Pseudorhodoferax sp.]|uniref:ABC transporter substrate-binding protein n=1 Tax=Pseudorhodoferax sp. TaxID=1993553 RepID=UPI002DD6B97F|nr:ABC transporter substrate-binding protein [Pseudorhodoferax sp.]